MAVNERELAILAHLSAQRAILVRLLVLGFLQEPEPAARARLVRDLLRGSPVRPPEQGSPLDPATSDLLAGMTEDEIERIMNEVITHLERRNAA